MLIEGYAVADVSEEIGERRLATLERLPAEVGAVELYEVESAQYGGVIANPIAENVEDREAALVDHDGLTVEQARSHRQTFKRCSDQRKAVGEIRAMAREEPNSFSVAPCHNAESVMLDLVNPIGPRRRLLSRPGEAWFNDRFATQEHRLARQ
jgi:hypothetical protein